MAICLRLLWQLAPRAFSRAWANTGNRIAARMAMIAITTSSSIRVNADFLLMMDESLLTAASRQPVSAERWAPRYLTLSVSAPPEGACRRHRERGRPAEACTEAGPA